MTDRDRFLSLMKDFNIPLTPSNGCTFSVGKTTTFKFSGSGEFLRVDLGPIPSVRETRIEQMKGGFFVTHEGEEQIFATYTQLDRFLKGEYRQT